LCVDAFEKKLRDNATSPTQVSNHLSEARVGLMFVASGSQVTMRESPELMIELVGELFYAEVKRFLRKGQDTLDELAERNTRALFVRVGDTFPTEKREPWEQIADVALKKRNQYVVGAANILVIDSDSEALEGMALSGANGYDAEVRRSPDDAALRRLNGIMIINVCQSISVQYGNVDFAVTRYPSRRMSAALEIALRKIRFG